MSDHTVTYGFASTKSLSPRKRFVRPFGFWVWRGVHGAKPFVDEKPLVTLGQDIDFIPKDHPGQSHNKTEVVGEGVHTHECIWIKIHIVLKIT